MQTHSLNSIQGGAKFRTWFNPVEYILIKLDELNNPIRVISLDYCRALSDYTPYWSGSILKLNFIPMDGFLEIGNTKTSVVLYLFLFYHADQSFSSFAF